MYYQRLRYIYNYAYGSLYYHIAQSYGVVNLYNWQIDRLEFWRENCWQFTIANISYYNNLEFGLVKY